MEKMGILQLAQKLSAETVERKKRGTESEEGALNKRETMFRNGRHEISDKIHELVKGYANR